MHDISINKKLRKYGYCPGSTRTRTRTRTHTHACARTRMYPPVYICTHAYMHYTSINK